MLGYLFPLPVFMKFISYYYLPALMKFLHILCICKHLPFWQVLQKSIGSKATRKQDNQISLHRTSLPATQITENALAKDSFNSILDIQVELSIKSASPTCLLMHAFRQLQDIFKESLPFFQNRSKLSHSLFLQL